MGFEIRAEEWARYVPKFAGIRDRWETGIEVALSGGAEPEPEMQVEIHSLSAAEARGYRSRLVLKSRKDGAFNVANGDDIDEAAFVKNVRMIAPYPVVLKGDQRVELSTSKLLWDKAPPALVDEIKEAIFDVSCLEEGRRDG